jgi:CBS domain containing-hemolysin-like protein
MDRGAADARRPEPSPLLFAADPSDTHLVWTILGLLSIPALVAMNGFFVAAEFALVAIRKTRVEEMVNQGVPRAKAVEGAIDNLDRTIAATQLGITLASIALGWVGEWALARLMEPWFEFLPAGQAFVTRHTIAVAISFTLVTFLHVVFGELIPKAIALQTPDKTSLWVSPPLNLFSSISRPVISVMNGLANWLIRRLGYKPSGEEQEVHSIEELRLLVEDTEEAGLISADAADVLLNVFALSDKTVQDVMVPWEKVMSLELTTPPDKILEAVREGAHTRMPVYQGTPDTIVGIVNTKDLFYLFSLRGVVVLEDALYDAQFLPPGVPVSVALRLFRRSHRPMAVVRDQETKKTLGILTLEDVLEEIIGDIEDEQDDPTRRRELFTKILRRGGSTKPPGK